MSGLSLNHQLEVLDAHLVCATKTAPQYKLYDITQQGDSVARPGLIRVPDGGSSIEVEVWDMTADNFGVFASKVAKPLSFGNVDLEDGTSVKGFLCEPYIIPNSKDITSTGGWRHYTSKKKQKD